MSEKAQFPTLKLVMEGETKGMLSACKAYRERLRYKGVINEHHDRMLNSEILTLRKLCKDELKQS